MIVLISVAFVKEKCSLFLKYAFFFKWSNKNAQHWHICNLNTKRKVQIKFRKEMKMKRYIYLIRKSRISKRSKQHFACLFLLCIEIKCISIVSICSTHFILSITYNFAIVSITKQLMFGYNTTIKLQSFLISEQKLSHCYALIIYSEQAWCMKTVPNTIKAAIGTSIFGKSLLDSYWYQSIVTDHFRGSFRCSCRGFIKMWIHFIFNINNDIGVSKGAVIQSKYSAMNC